MGEFDQMQYDLTKAKSDLDDLQTKYYKLKKLFNDHEHTGYDDSQALTPNTIINNNTGGGGNANIITGKMKTINATPVTANLVTMVNGQPLFVMATVTALDQIDGYQNGFIRNAVLKFNGTTVTGFDQIQDAFTMRQAAYNVDFTNSGSTVQLRVWGLLGQTVYWTYAVTVMKFNL
jgi:hypothetical protein